jgi:hypothetical protein
MQEHEWGEFNMIFEILHKNHIMTYMSTAKHNLR